MLENFDCNSLRESVNFLPSDSIAAFRYEDGSVIALFPVFLRESDGEPFVKVYNEWKAVTEARFGRGGKFSHYEKIFEKKLFNTATLNLEVA